MLIGLLLIASCGQDSLNKQHDMYLSNKGWEIKKLVKVDTSILEIPEEILSNYEASGITFLRQYIGVEVTIYYYVLKEKDSGNTPLEAIIYEENGDIVGSYGILPSWEPGRFNLDDKERLKTEQIIK